MTSTPNPTVVNPEKFTDKDDDFVGIKARIIKFKTPKKKFIFKPITGYSFDTPNPYIVIIYQLEVINKMNGTTYRAIIPYYLSDGSTNNLRANLIFPFVCFNEKDRNNLICPYNQTKATGLLYKYSAGINIKLDLQSSSSSTGPTVTSTDAPMVFPKSPSTGIDSVLPRMKNLLDFIICLIFSNKLDNNLIVYDLLSFRPFNKSAKSTWNYNFNAIPIKKDLQIEKDLDYKRKEILEYLTLFKNDIQMSNIFSTEKVYVILSKISIKTFNQKYGIVCHKTAMCSGLKNTANNNFKNYVSISHEFFQSFVELKDKIPNHFKSVLLKSNFFVKDQSILQHIDRGFVGSTCNPGASSAFLFQPPYQK
jgi:hypothetical protein